MVRLVDANALYAAAKEKYSAMGATDADKLEALAVMAAVQAAPTIEIDTKNWPGLLPDEQGGMGK